MTEKDYIAQLNAMEQKVLNIARTHLETSFSLKKSIGFQEWQKAQAQPNEQASAAQAQPNEIVAQPNEQASAAQAQPNEVVAQPNEVAPSEAAPNEVAQNEVAASEAAPPPVIIKRKRKIKIAASTKLLAV